MSDKWYIYEKIVLLNKIWVMEAFHSFGKYNNFQSDNLLCKSEYSNFSYNSKNHWMNEYLAFQLYIQVFW